MKIYGFYRPDYIGNFDFQNGTSLNGKYTLSFWINGQYGDYIKAGVISIKDMEISTDRYTKEIIPGVKDLREFVIYEYNSDYIDDALMNKIIGKIGQRFDLELLTIEEAKTFLRNHTNLEEVSEGKFKVSDENIFGDQIIEAKYIEII